MQSSLKAVIFDMDGVLINSEPLWRRAMIKGFTGLGLDFTEDDCRKTMGNRFPEVVAYWLDFYKLSDVKASDVEETVMNELYALIEAEGKFIEGIPAILDFCSAKKLKTGLATSSSNQLMNQVLKKLNLHGSLDAVVSAEHMKYGKPHPEVFLHCAEQLNMHPGQCLVIEDSLNGVISAKAAQMKVIAVPDEEHRTIAKFALADYNLNSMHQVLDVFKTLWPDSK
ncbi:MAG: hexitol phosphatase HxpB [Bacteroidota bacterium]